MDGRRRRRVRGAATATTSSSSMRSASALHDDARDVRSDARRERRRRVPSRVRPSRAEALRRCALRLPRDEKRRRWRVDRGLRADRRPADRRARRPRRLDRLALPAALRLRRLLRRAARRRPSTAAGCSRPRASSARSRRRYRGDTLVLETELETADGAVRADRLHAAARDEARTSSASSRACAGASPMRMELVIRFDYGSIVPVGAHASTARSSRSPGPDALCAAHAGRATTATDLTHRRATFTVARGRARAVRPHAGTRRNEPPPRADRRRATRSPRPSAFWQRVGGALHATTGAWHDAVHALAAHAQGAHLRADRRHRRRADDVAARVDRRRAQLGLPLLLAARRDAHAARAASRAGYVEEARRLARLAAARGRRATRRTCRSCTASPASAGSPSSSCRWLARLRGLAARCASATRASDQLQLDVYGEVIDALLPGARARARRRPTTPGALQRRLCSTSSSTAGASPTRASGRCAARAGTSRTRR